VPTWAADVADQNNAVPVIMSPSATMTILVCGIRAKLELPSRFWREMLLGLDFPGTQAFGRKYIAFYTEAEHTCRASVYPTPGLDPLRVHGFASSSWPARQRAQTSPRWADVRADPTQRREDPRGARNGSDTCSNTVDPSRAAARPNQRRRRPYPRSPSSCLACPAQGGAGREGRTRCGTPSARTWP
jgi:hypothetical protein